MGQRRSAKRWEHPHYKYAYVREYRGMACTVIHGSPPRSTGYEWKATNRADALRVLERRLRDHIGGRTPAPVTALTCADLFDAFAKVRFPAITKAAQSRYTKAFELYVPSGLPLTDHRLIRDAVLHRMKGTEYSTNTKRLFMKRLRTVFAFAIAEGWMTANPIRADMVPAEVSAKHGAYTDDDIVRIIEALTDRAQLFVRFMAASGCRPKEACDLTWADVHHDHVVIHGKRKRMDKERPRLIPFALCPELPEVLADAHGISEGRVFGYTNYVNVAERVREVCDRLGIQHHGLHGIRRWKVDLWARRSGWPVEVREAIAGHTRDVADRHYVQPLTVTGIIDMTNTRRSS